MKSQGRGQQRSCVYTYMCLYVCVRVHENTREMMAPKSMRASPMMLTPIISLSVSADTSAAQYACMRVRIRTHFNKYKRAAVCVCVCVCVFVCVCVCVIAYLLQMCKHLAHPL
jgi:hypothetical protein